MFLELLTTQGLEKGAILCFRNPNFFGHGESTSTASQKSKDLNKVSLLLQDLDQVTVKFVFWVKIEVEIDWETHLPVSKLLGDSNVQSAVTLICDIE